MQSQELLSVAGSLLVTSSKGVFELRQDQFLPIRSSSASAISLCQSSRNPDRVFAGFQGGLASILHTPKGWVDEGLVPGVVFDIYSIAEASDGRLWLGTGAQGVMRVTFPPGWQGGTTGGLPAVEAFTMAQGLPTDSEPTIHILDGQVRFATHEGVYLFREASGRFEPDPRFHNLFPGGPRWIKKLRPDAQGRIWMETVDEIRRTHETGMAVPREDGSYRWDASPFRRFSELTVEAILIEAGGVAWFGGPGGALRCEVGAIGEPAEPPAPLIRRVTARGLGMLSPEQALAYSANTLRFEFALPSFDLESANLYQVRMAGLDRDWSPWTAEAQKEYTNLPEGTYCFQLRGRDGYGSLGSVALFPFRILPPWYRTWWAYLAYGGLGAILILAGVRIRVRLLQARNRALEKRVVMATEDLQDRERMLAAQASTLTTLNGELQAVNGRLQKANEQKDRFLGIVVHDLRNPLNGILLSAQLIEKGLEPDDLRRKAAGISIQASEMSLLIDRFLDIAALDAGGVHPEPETFPLADLLLETTERHGGLARQKGIELGVEPLASAGMIHADRKFLRSVLDNLVSNALKFSPPGSAVRLQLVEAGGRVQATVVDQGPGLTEADLHKLFGRFSKLSARPTAGEQSVGLGLSIAKELVEATGGRIWVESRPGCGATFSVAFPSAPERA